MYPTSTVEPARYFRIEAAHQQRAQLVRDQLVPGSLPMRSRPGLLAGRRSPRIVVAMHAWLAGGQL